MFYFVHLLVGALVGKYFPSLFIVIILSFLIHFVLDILPHWDGFWDKKDYKKNYFKKLPIKNLIVELIDISVAVFVFICLFNFNNFFILIGAFFCVLPDILKIFYLTPLKNLNFYKKYLSFHTRMQNDVSFILGILIQLLISIIAILLLIHKL